MLRKALAAVPILFLAACGSDVSDKSTNDPSPGGGGTGGGVVGGQPIGGSGGDGGSGGAAVAPSLVSASAPTEDTVRLVFDGPVSGAAADLNNYALASTQVGPLDATAIDVQGSTVTLSTTKQKLGVTYEVTFTDGQDEASESFLAADTARFWAADFTDPNFSQYEIVADRTIVGDNVVVYLEQGESFSNAQDAAEHFDDEVYPIETSSFTAAPDRDGNQRVVLLGLDGKGAYGGYFNPVDTLPDDQTFPLWGYHSNEKELLYLNVENGFLVEADVVVPHEFSHLLYQEIHPSLTEGYAYHNEGLAECAVNLVNGAHGYALDVYIADPLGDLTNGISLVDWEYGNYSQYVQAYVFWSYIAGQLGGAASYADLMQVNGDPVDMQIYLQQQLGKSFSETQLSTLIATWADLPSGEHSFNGVITMPGKPQVATNANSLPPLTGVFMTPVAATVDYPGGQGADIVYAAIDPQGNVDLTAPFAVNGGALVVYNSAFLPNGGSSQPIGLMPAPVPSAQPTAKDIARSRAWLHPPPFNPERLDELRAWRKRTRLEP